MSQHTLYSKETSAKRTRIDGEYFFQYTGADQMDRGGEFFSIQQGDFSKFAVVVDCVLSEDDVERLIAILGYYWKTIVKGKNSLNVETYALHNGDNTVIVFKNGLYEFGVKQSFSKTPELRFAEFTDSLNDLIARGTKTRKDGQKRAEGFSYFISAKLFLNEVVEVVEESPEQKAAPAPAVKVEIPWEDNSTDYFTNKNADDLTFSDVRLLLATLRVEQQKNAALKEKVTELEGKLNVVKSVFN